MRSNLVGCSTGISAGFREVETRFVNPPFAEEELGGLDERVREILFAPLDYAILARS